MLRAQYGNDIAVVSIGPCIAEKKEAEEHPELLDVALTFEDLDFWLTERHIKLERSCGLRRTTDFEPEEAEEGALFPIEGGMAPGLTGEREIDDVGFIALSGMQDVEQALKDISEWKPEHRSFL